MISRQMTVRETTARELTAVPDCAAEVVFGLTSHPKTLPCKLFYDDHGSALFERITELREYYPTRTELEILQTSSREIALAAGPAVSIVELGAGTATKTGTLLRAFARQQLRVQYFPVDISPAALAAAQQRVREDCPGAVVRPVIADFSNGFNFLQNISGRKLVLYLGSSIGNFDGKDAVALLSKVRQRLSPDDALLLGTDMVKSPAVLVPAYDDAQGVTAEFNRNVLRVVNRELDADFDPAEFEHVAWFDPHHEWIEMRLRAVAAQLVSVRALDMRVRFAAGEEMRTEISAKFTRSRLEGDLAAAGLELAEWLTDPDEQFAVSLVQLSR